MTSLHGKYNITQLYSPCLQGCFNNYCRGVQILTCLTFSASQDGAFSTPILANRAGLALVSSFGALTMQVTDSNRGEAHSNN